MKKLLSLPPNLVECFHDIEHANHQEWFCTSDPVGSKFGWWNCMVITSMQKQRK